jgi:hypothetical protein
MGLELTPNELVVLLAGTLTPEDGVSDNFLLGAFDNENDLSKAVDVWSKIHADCVLHYRFIGCNNTDGSIK